jgi:hypothetical protein
LKCEWGALLVDLDRLQEIETEQDGKRFILRTPVTGDVGRAFQAVGVALPPNIREAPASADRRAPGSGPVVVLRTCRARAVQNSAADFIAAVALSSARDAQMRVADHLL